MALSRYTVLPNQAIVNTHVAQDLTLVNRVLATKQGAYDEAAAFDQAQEGVFAKHQVRNADIARRDALHDDYVQKAQELVEGQYNGDYSQAMPALKKLANGYAGNEFWNRASSALDREKEDYKTRSDLRKSGKSILDFAPGMTQKAIYNEDGTYNDIEYNTQGQSDWMKARKDALGKLEASGGSGGLTGSGVGGLLRHMDSEGISLNDVQRVAMANFQGYLKGSEGQQEYNYLRARGRNDRDAQKEVLMNLAAAGNNQIHSKSKAGYIGIPGWAEAQRAKAKKAEEDAQGMLRQPESNTGFSDNPANGNKVSIDEKGRVYTERMVNQSVTDPLSGASMGTAPAAVRDYQQAPSIIKSMRSNLDKMYPPVKGAAPRSDAEVAKLWNNAIETNGSRSFITQKLAPSRDAAVNSMVLGDNYRSGKIEGLAGSSVIPIQMGGGGAPISLEMWRESVGEIKSAKITGSMLRVPGMPAAYRLVVTNKDGKIFEAAVPGPNQESDYKSRIQPLIDAAASGKETMVEYGNRIYKTTVAPNINGKGFKESVRIFEQPEDGGAPRPLRLTTQIGGKTVYQRDSNGKIKVAPAISLDDLSRSFDARFIADNGDLYNTRQYNNNDEKSELYQQTPEE